MTDARTRWEKTEASPNNNRSDGNGDDEGKKQRDKKSAAESMHHDGSFGRYMALKVVKLREQFDAQQLQTTEAKSDIFRGVSIHVNGFTRPSHAELKQLMALHGGRFENYLYRDSVTHIICSNLPDTKIKQLAHERKPIPIVRPEWIVASITAGRLLPIADFQLEPLTAADPHQRRLFDFKRHAAPQLAPAELYPVLEQQQRQQRGQQQRQQNLQQPQPERDPMEEDLGRGNPWQEDSAAAAEEEEGQQQQHAEEEQVQEQRPMHPAQGLWAADGGGVRDPADRRPAKRLRASSDDTPAGAGLAAHVGAWAPGLSQGLLASGHGLGQEQFRGLREVGQGLEGAGDGGTTGAMGGAASARMMQGEPAAAAAAAPGGNAASAPLLPAQTLPPPGQAWQERGAPAATEAGNFAFNGLCHGNGSGAVPAPGAGTGPGPPPSPGAAAAGGAGMPSATATAAGAGAGVGSPSGTAGGGGGGAGAGLRDPAQALAADLRAAHDQARGQPRSTRNDPNFMSTFFAQSRLHFIGTWKARIEALMAEVEAGAPAPAPYAKGTERVIVHVDMDCFFASVAAVGRPELAGRPLAVSHSNSERGTSEVSSANYLARSFGVRADMFMAEARRRCPDLVVVPYEFPKYQAVSEQVYRILLSYTSIVQPVSCDEAFLDLTGLAPGGDPEALVARLRAEVAAATQCTASAGIGPNMLVAKLATRRAKPNGQFRVSGAGVLEFLGDLKVEDLPGVGWSLTSKLEALGISRVRQVWSSSRTLLQKQLGAKVGADLWAHAHGVDDRRVEPPKARKSVGAEVNYGIRFEPDGQAEAERFLGELAGEVAGRLKAAGLKGRSLTLKVKRRQAGAPEPAKFLGHGACDNISRSVTLSRFTDAPADLRREAVALLRALAIPPDELRGLGLTVSRLDNDPASHTTRPSAPAPAKLQAPPRTAFDASKPPPWVTFFQRRAQQEKQQQQQQEPQEASPEPGQEQGGPAAAPGPPPDATVTPTKHRSMQGPLEGPGDAAGRSPPPGQGGRGADRSTPQAGATGPHGAPGSRPGAAAAAAAAAAGGHEACPDVPSWYASMYNEWSPVSAWEQQRRERQQQQQRQRQLGVAEPSPPRGQQRSTSPPVVLVEAHDRPEREGPPRHPQQQRLRLPSRVQEVPLDTRRSESPKERPQPQPRPPPPQQQQRPSVQGPNMAAGGGAPGAVIRAGAGGAAGSLGPHLHPVFAALLSQPVDLTAGTQAEAAGLAGAGAGVGAVAGKSDQVVAAAAAAARLPGEGVAAASAPVSGRRGAFVAAAPAPQAFALGGGCDGGGAAAPAATAPAARTAAALPHNEPVPSHAAPPPAPPPAPRTAASGTHAGGTTASAQAASPPRGAAQPAPRPAASAMSAGAAASGAHRGPEPPRARQATLFQQPQQHPHQAGAAGRSVQAAARPVESIDLSTDFDGAQEDGDEVGGEVCAGGGEEVEVEVVGEVGAGPEAAAPPLQQRREAAAAGDSVRPRGAGTHAVRQRQAAELAQPTRSEASGQGQPGGIGGGSAGGALGPRPAARPAHSGSTVGAPAGSTSAASTANAARWPAFLRPMTSATLAAPGARQAAGRGSGRGRGRGRGAGQAGRAAGGQAGRGAAGATGAMAAGGAGPSGAAQIDLSVLAELPPDVRREVEREYGLLPSVPARRPAAAPPAETRPAKRGRTAVAQAQPAAAATTRAAAAAAAAEAIGTAREGQAGAAAEAAEAAAASGARQAGVGGSRPGQQQGAKGAEGAAARGAAGAESRALAGVDEAPRGHTRPGVDAGDAAAVGVELVGGTGVEGSARGEAARRAATLERPVPGLPKDPQQGRPPSAVPTTGGAPVAAPGAGPSAPAARHTSAAPAGAGAPMMPTSMADVDLAVLDELPPELRSEITAALRGAHNNNHNQGPGGPQRPDPAGAGPSRPPQPQHQHYQPQARVGRHHPALDASGPAAAGQPHAPHGSAVAVRAVAGTRHDGGGGAREVPGRRQGGVAAGGLASAESAGSDVVEVAAVAVLPAGAGPPQRLEAAAGHMFRVGGPLPVAGEPESGCGLVREALLQSLRAACAGVCGQAGGHGEGGEVEGEGKAEEEGGRVAADGEGDDGAREFERGVQAVCMTLALWLIGQDRDLEGVVALLRQVRRMVAAATAGMDGGGGVVRNGACRERVAVLKKHVSRAITAVQRHVYDKYGFVLKL